ncbi:MAG: terpene cyclase/mutase family protein [Myxococcaceae bacterium]|nr:terpene cyclase/mutase family protein [Myxococcaceae bacterium]
MSTAHKLSPETELRAEARAAMEYALQNLSRLQSESGSWPGDYGGPMFLLPMYVGLCHATKRLPDAHKAERMKTYFFNVQRKDGSIGLHAESSEGSMFCTSLSYVALRMLGAPASDPRVTKRSERIHANGTPLGAASWGKFTRCVLGLYDWEGIHAVPPELWLLPWSAPMHPGRFWCHCRQVYLPMAWLYGSRSTMPTDALVEQLREELYDGRWSSIRWAEHRDSTSGADDYRPLTQALAGVNAVMDRAERLPFKPLRKRALAECLKHIQFEDRVTSYIDIGPVNAVLNAFVHFFRGAEGRDELEKKMTANDVYLWDGHDGLKFQGYNGSELWDTAFAVQAIFATPFADDPRFASMLEKAHAYVRDNQILEDVPSLDEHYRHASKGGWPFSNRAHGWPITDCTSEGFKCALLFEPRGYEPEVPLELLRDSVKLMLSWQNEDGGWATYELQRSGKWLEQLNPSQVFGEIMVDYSYVECTSASVQALVKAKRRFPGEFDVEIDAALRRAESYLRRQQRPDGSFEGSWAVCFTYGTWFAMSALEALGVTPKDGAMQRAAQFLLEKQRPDGAWGEAGDTCRERRWVEAKDGQVAQTSWAMLALMKAGCTDHDALERAARFLISRQETDGSWAREPLVGVFNKTCLINYDNYRHYFPLWALAEWSKH